MSNAPIIAESAPRRGTASPLVVAAFALALLGGCGGGGSGGGGGGGPPPAVVIATASLPSGGLGLPYSVTLSVSGGSVPFVWTLAPGSTLPPGLFLSATGVLSGAPVQLGSFGFGVSVIDGANTTDSASYSLVVAPFSASIALLHFGEAWSGEGYPLSATGGAGTTFSLVQNQSGAQITNAVPSSSTARYVAGATPGLDRIRAAGSGGGFVDLDVLVQSNPVADMTARFANSDVWHLRFDGQLRGARVRDRLRLRARRSSACVRRRARAPPGPPPTRSPSCTSASRRSGTSTPCT